MRCILGDQGRELLQEIHADTCGHHAGPRTLRTRRTSCDVVKGASSTLDKLISRCKRCR
jgi:hypothetical protein